MSSGIKVPEGTKDAARWQMLIERAEAEYAHAAKMAEASGQVIPSLQAFVIGYLAGVAHVSAQFRHSLRVVN